MGGSISSENTRTNITISKELKAQLEELAKKDNRSFNSHIITSQKTQIEVLIYWQNFAIYITKILDNRWM